MEEQYNIPQQSQQPQPQQLEQMPVTEQPEPAKKKDDMADLFNVDRNDLLDTEDLIKVDMNRDIIDANSEGDLSDLTEVTKDDVMGDEFYGQTPLDGGSVQRRQKAQPKYKLTQPYTPPTQIGGLSS